MKNKKVILNLILYFLIISIPIFLLSYNYIDDKKDELLKRKYTLLAKNMREKTEALIDDKKNATLAFGISLSKIQNISNALEQNNYKLLELRALSLELRKTTDFKNVWVQLIRPNGTSFYRTWKEQRDDSILVREDIKRVLNSKKVTTQISIGKCDMVFSAMIPLYKDKVFIGILEVLTHFNSIAKKLKAQQIEPVFTANKEYQKIITKPFSKIFIDGCYVANYLVNKKMLDFLRKNGITNYKNITDYRIVDNYFITTLQIGEKKSIGTAILFKYIDDIDISQITSFKKTSVIFLNLALIILAILMLLYFYYRYTKRINFERVKIQNILDSQSNIIIITDGEKLITANQQLTNFFSEFRNIEEFKKVHKCVCERFVDLDDENYLIEKEYEKGKNWAEYLLNNLDKNFKAAMYKDDRLHHFSLKVSRTDFKSEDNIVIVTLSDITDEIQTKEKLENLNENLEQLVNEKVAELKELNENLELKVAQEVKKSKDKDRLLFQQNKMAAMGEMLNNIAHQWRQPLSSITTSITGMQIQKENDLLDDETFDISSKIITNNCQYLSQTIEDFKNFFRQDKTKEKFLISDSILHNTEILQASIIEQNIAFVKDIDKNYSVYGYKNEFQQALLNIFNNAIEVLTNNNEANNRFIFITLKEDKLSIKDNGGGINPNIIDKIFEPYFTTKHQSQGTGIGLYMTQEILIKHMKFDISVKNSSFEYKDREQKGIEFIIDLSS